MVSVVIFSRNNEDRIGRTLAGIFAQKYRDFEVLSCDGGSTDRTGQILDTYPEVRRLRPPPELDMPGGWFNWILPECRGETVVFNHATACPLDADYLGELLKPLKSSSRVAAVFARREPRDDAPFPVWREMEQELHSPGVEQKFSFAAAAIRKEILAAHPVDKTLPMEFGAKWAKEVRETGEQIIYAYGARVEFSRPVSWRTLFWLRNQEAFYGGERITRRENLKRFFHDLKLDGRAVRRTRYYTQLPGIIPWRLVEGAARRAGFRPDRKKRHAGALTLLILLLILFALLLCGVYIMQK